MKYSVIIPVYNRPGEIDELLESLTRQTFTNIEVLVIEDGSAITCEKVVEKYRDRLDIQYFFKENSGQGFTRNYGYERAKGDYFVVFDSDCLIPADYFETVENHLNTNWLDAYGGPDKAHESFTVTQKAINYAMTSLFTTGGTRGNKLHVGEYHPRSFNMGISPEVYRKTSGYIMPRMAEDLEFSIRIIRSGFKAGFIEKAFVYHKRRTSLLQFFRQIQFFGRGRINLTRFFPGQVKLTHLFPLVFTIGLLSLIVLPVISPSLFYAGMGAVIVYLIIILIDALVKTKSLSVSIVSVAASLILLTAYGTGFAREGLKKIFSK